MEKLKTNFKDKFLNKNFFKLAFKNLVLIAFIVIFIILFSAIFGSENQLIGVALITGILLFRKVGIGIDIKQAPFVIFAICIIIAICNLLSYINIYLAILINAIAVFTLMILSTIRLEYKTYITFILFYIFAQGTPIPEGRVLYRISTFILSGIILATIHFIYNKNNENCKKVSEIFSGLNLQNASFVFTLKMTIGITIAMFFADILGFAKGMWISITVMSLTQPEFEITKNRIKWRVSGTLIGALIYFVLFEHILPENSIIFITFILSYIYTFIKHYRIQMIFITINALNAAKGIFTSGHPIIFRVSFLFLGILIALLIVFLENKFFTKKNKLGDEEIKMKKFDENYILLKDLYSFVKDDISEISEKTLDKLKSYIEELISFLEKGDLNLEKIQNELDKMTNKINILDEKEDYFIGTVEREIIAEDIIYILKWFNIDLDIEDALAMGDW